MAMLAESDTPPGINRVYVKLMLRSKREHMDERYDTLCAALSCTVSNQQATAISPADC